MKKLSLLLFLFAIEATILSSTANAESLTSDCVTRAIGSDTEYSPLRFDGADAVYSDSIDGDDYHIIMAKKSTAPNWRVEILMKNCSVVMIDAPGNGIDYAQFLPSSKSQVFNSKSREYWQQIQH